jgi:SOS-response transcriptional repressor LexA
MVYGGAVHGVDCYDNRNRQSSGFTNAVRGTFSDWVYEGRMRKQPRPWITARLKELGRGYSKSGLAKAMKLPPPRITEIIKGEREIKVEEIPAAADYLKWDELTLSRRLRGDPLVNVPLSQVKVIGAVQAGKTREAMEWPEDEWYPSGISPLRRYAGVPQFALEVRGDSMNEKFPEGTILVCINLIEFGSDPRTGHFVIVQRRERDGSIEATVKELNQQPDGTWWLLPRSTNPEFVGWQLPKEDPFGGDDEDITITALVISYTVPTA